VASLASILAVQMDANAAGLNDPKGASWRSLVGQRKEIMEPIQQRSGCGPRTRFQNDQSRAAFWRKSQDLAKVVIRSSLARTVNKVSSRAP
jgi:hypothetical protein